MIARFAHTRPFRNAARFAVAAGIAAGVVSCKDTTGPITPETPTGVTVVLLSTTSAKVTWTASSDPASVRSYNVFRNGNKVGEVTGPLFVDTGLSELVTYRYGVSANGVNGLESATSDDTPANVITPPDATPPTVTLTSPSNAATGVDRASKITATFSEALDAATAVAANFSVSVTGGAAIPGSIIYSSATKTIEFTPTTALPSSTAISVAISTGIKDGAGNAMASPVTFSFTTRDDIPPSVVSTTIPASGDVQLSQVISATMSEPIDASSLTSATVRLTAGSAVAGTISYDSPSRTITFTPTGGLTGSTDYLFIVGPGIKDVAGNASTAAFSKSFRTVDTAPPTVTSVTPVNGATSVSLNTSVVIAFSKALNPATITPSTISVAGQGLGIVSGSLTYDAASASVTFTPVSPLQNDVLYTVAVTTGVRDAAGTALAPSFASTFRTVSAGPPADQIPPTVVSSLPANGATDVAVNTPVSVTFSEAMNATTVNSSTILLNGPGGATISGSVSYNTSTLTATLIPSAALQSGTSYTLIATTGLKDAAGNNLAPQFSASFATVGSIPPSDTTPPTVSSTLPSNGSTNVAVTTAIRVTFSEAMKASTINASTIGLSVVGIPVSGTVSYDASSRTATFLESAGILAEGKVYTITVTTGVTDASGNPMASAFSSTFQTQDVTPPSIVSRSPSPGSTGVATNSTIRVGFNEAMTPSTINSSTLSLSVGGSPVAGSVSYDQNTNIATFTPSGSLANNQTYSVLVTTGARDLSGNALSTNDSFSFTTAAAPPAFDISGVTGSLGWWQTTTAGLVGIHFHIVFDQNGSTLSRSSICSSAGQDSCITLAQNQAGQDAIGPVSPPFVWVLITNATGVLSGNQISFTLTNANGRTFTFNGTVTSPYHMTGTISGPTLPAEVVSFDRPTP